MVKAEIKIVNYSNIEKICGAGPDLELKEKSKEESSKEN